MNIYPTDPFRILNARHLSIAPAACAVLVGLFTAACWIEAQAQPASWKSYIL
jgi:hypothetical protein